MPLDDTPQGTGPEKSSPLKTGSLDAIEDAIMDDILKESDEDNPEGDAEPRQGPEGDEDVGEGDDPDAETADESDTDDEVDGQPRDEKGRFLSDDAKVRLDDGSVTTLAELKKGSLRQADYTRKTQEIAEQKRFVDDGNRRVQQLETQLAQTMDWVGEVLAYRTPQRPDRSMIGVDPIGYQEKMAEYEEHVQYMQSLANQRQQQLQRQQQQTHQQTDAQLREGVGRLLEAIPALKDKTRMESFREEALKYGTEVYGFGADEINGITEPKALVVLNDAIKWRKLQENKSKALDKSKGKPPLTPGRRQEPEAVRARSRDKDIQALKSTGGKGHAGEAAWDRLADKFV